VKSRRVEAKALSGTMKPTCDTCIVNGGLCLQNYGIALCSGVLLLEGSFISHMFLCQNFGNWSPGFCNNICINCQMEV